MFRRTAVQHREEKTMAEAARRIRKLEDLTEADIQRMDELSEQLRPPPAEILLDVLRRMESVGTPEYTDLDMVTAYEHSLQAATRAHKDGEDEEMVVVALLHDIADQLSPYNHDDVGAEILRPYISDNHYWMLQHHAIFQLFHIRKGTDQDRNVRDQYRDHPAYKQTVRFCAKYDQTAFDPDYESLPLSFFEPMVARVINAERARVFETVRLGGA
jgi:predicted HD phosphohydrolase